MTKIAIVSDVHLKLRKHKDFERKRFRQLISKLAESDANIVIFNGDLLDYSIPTLEEIKEVNDAFFVLTQDKEVWLLDGNHEAVDKVHSTYDYLSFANVLRPKEGSQEITVENTSIRLCGWSKIGELKDTIGSDILISHYRSAMEGLYQEEVPTANFVNKYKLILLGDIHSRYSPLPHIFYTGSPYSISSTRDTRNKYGYIELQVEGHAYSWKYIDLNLPQKIKVSLDFSKLQDFKPLTEHLYTVEVTGTMQELKTLSNYDNVTFIKKAELSKPPTVVTKTKNDKSFIDNLSEKVEMDVSSKSRHKVKSILVQIEGGS